MSLLRTVDAHGGTARDRSSRSLSSTEIDFHATNIRPSRDSSGPRDSPRKGGDDINRPLLQIVIASTRPGRAGETIARWFHTLAEGHGGFDLELVDLAEVALPLFDEPHHPASGHYLHEHTLAWSARVRRADAFVFVAPEYNHSMNAALKNALDYLHDEWRHKAVGFVSYGGVAAGTRAVQAIRLVAQSLSMVPVYEVVNIAFFRQYLDDDGDLVPDERLVRDGQKMLDSILSWEQGLRLLRT
jgi:NAD(P)H-dependent FMN reductase